MSNLDRSMHKSLWVKVTHNSFIEGSHMTKNMAAVTSVPYDPEAVFLVVCDPSMNELLVT